MASIELRAIVYREGCAYPVVSGIGQVRPSNEALLREIALQMGDDERAHDLYVEMLKNGVPVAQRSGNSLPAANQFETAV